MGDQKKAEELKNQLQLAKKRASQTQTQTQQVIFFLLSNLINVITNIRKLNQKLKKKVKVKMKKIKQPKLFMFLDLIVKEDQLKYPKLLKTIDQEKRRKLILMIQKDSVFVILMMMIMLISMKWFEEKNLELNQIPMHKILWRMLDLMFFFFWKINKIK